MTNEVSRKECGNIPTIERLYIDHKERKDIISNDYDASLNECDYNVGLENYPTSHDQIINGESSTA